MKLWLLCFVILFAAAEGLQGVSGGFNLFPAISWHPLAVLAGIGLAVLSNAKSLGLGSRPSPSVAKPPASSPPAASIPVSSAPATALGASSTPPPKAGPSLFPRATPKPAAKAPADSISFDLRKSS